MGYAIAILGSMERPVMKITDITVTLFAWDDIPATQYGRHSGRFSGKSDLGLVTIKTDQGLEGHAFLGSSSRPASGDANLIAKSSSRCWSARIRSTASGIFSACGRGCA